MTISMLLRVSALNGSQIGTIMLLDREKVANYIDDRDKYSKVINGGKKMDWSVSG